MLDELRVAAALAAFSAATVHEAYGRRGSLSAEVKPIAPGLRVCAPVMTVRTVPGNNLPVHQGLYRTPPGWVLAVATGGDHTFGYWGDLLTEAAMAHGVSGLVIEGGVRDLKELRETAFPIFAGAHALRGTTKIADGGVGETISLAGIDVSVGDVLVGDDDGLVRVRLSDVPAVAQAAAERVVAEERIRAALRSGATTLELYGFPPASSADPETDRKEDLA